MSHRIVDEELALLDEVATLLREVPYETGPREDDIVADLIRLRAEMPSAKEEDKGSLMAQYNQQVSLLEQIRAAKDRPQVDPESPYFAHLRLREGSKERDLCLGKATRIDRGIRIIDWRNAPISRIFYQYQQGEIYEEEIGERMLEGTVVARRTVTIRQGELLRVDAPEGSYEREASGWELRFREPPRLVGGQGAALRVHRDSEAARERHLGTDLEGFRRRADKRLPDIAGLIDPEQFDLITRPTSGFLVIRGSAGSGKTTVALHRIAWLAYQDAAYNSPRTLFLVFSQALRDYVSHVLPALGVEHVEVQTFRAWARAQRKRHFPRLPDRYRDDTPAVVTRLKLHPALHTALERQVAQVHAGPSMEQALDDWASVLTQADVLERALADVAPGAFTAQEIRRATTWSRDRYEEILAWLDGDREVTAELDEEDDALLLRAWQLRVGRLNASGKKVLEYKHIALDEVQDFSPTEVRVLLGCLDKSKSITLAGDTQQHIMQDAGFTSWTGFFHHLGVEGSAVNTLRISYRCSVEVMSFALALLGDLREDESPPVATRSGPPVEMFEFTDHGACVAFLADTLKELMRAEPLASVAVLTPGGDLSGSYYDGLRRGEVPRLRRVTEQDFTFAPGVEVTEVEQVKGLEFDYVVLVEASAARYPEGPEARRMLHVGATRAVHQLWLTSVGTTSSIVREAMAELAEGRR